MDIFQITGSHLREIRKRAISDMTVSRDSFVDCINRKYVHSILSML